MIGFYISRQMLHVSVETDFKAFSAINFADQITLIDKGSV